MSWNGVDMKADRCVGSHLARMELRPGDEVAFCVRMSCDHRAQRMRSARAGNDRPPSEG
ncbi:cytochrome P450 [Nonomuraea sp. NBC_00507]|uniref:hypothetical protein n=1 Tax=Nonomuraea sp. NBC_00507 TaxID=2976002 RepID=UPI002E16C9A5